MPERRNDEMIKIADFIFRNWRIFALVYAIGGTVVFILSLVFMRLLAKWADYGWKNTARVIIVSLFLSVLCAVLWPVIPFAFFGVLFLTEIAERFPSLMGHLADDDSEGDEKGGVPDEYSRADPGHGSCDGRRGFPESEE